LQPGAESDDVIEYCRNIGMKIIYDTCILTSLAE
jgi:predicted CoA-binding protein